MLPHLKATAERHQNEYTWREYDEPVALFLHETFVIGRISLFRGSKERSAKHLVQ